MIKLGWKSLYSGTLATMAIAAVLGVFDTQNMNVWSNQKAVSSLNSANGNPNLSPSPNVAPPDKSQLAPFINETNSPVKSQPLDGSQTYLDKAKVYLALSQASDYNKAIAQARNIQPNQPLYEQAQKDIERWTLVILDIAEGRAKAEKFEQAIAAAKLVPTLNEVNYRTAKAAIAQWQQQGVEFQANRKLLRKAQGLIQKEQASSYNQAIALAQLITPDQQQYAQSRKLINDWSQTILQIAQKRASEGKLDAAIKAATLVPSNTPAYKPAQEAIAKWKL